MQPLSITAQFAHILWHYTLSDENLFDLSKEDLYVYTLLIKEVTKS